MLKREVFCQRLKELRTTHNLAQEQLGEKLGAAKQTVGHWETGYRLPPFDVAVAIAEYFHVSLDYLAGLSDKPERK